MKLLNELFNEDVSQTPQEAKGSLVPNKQPLLKNFPYKIAICGEAPGADEVDQLTPFVGMSGRMLSGLLSKAGIVRDACFVGNVCQIRPPGNDITKFAFGGAEIESGCRVLTEDLTTFNPNICLLLGRTPLRIAKGTESIGDWRGSVFISDRPGPFFGRKCIAAYHPAACLRQYEWTPLLIFDIKKCLAEATRPTFEPPIRELLVNLSFEQTLEAMRKVQVEKPLISVDIEGGIDSMSCISIAPSADYSFIVPFAKRNGSSYYDNPDEELQIWRSLAIILGDPTIPKVLQNSLYDRFVLQYSYQIIMRGVVSDTMLQHHELYCELEKSLGFQCSIYTNEPYYKSERKTDDRDTFFRYCCRDSAVTYEITKKLDKFLDRGAKSHYDFNILLLNVLLYMANRGIKYDKKHAKQRLADLQLIIFAYQYDLDVAANKGFRLGLTRDDLIKQATAIICYKKNTSQPRAGMELAYEKVMALPPVPTKEDVGFINTICKVGMNIRSPKFKDYLYENIKLPKQWKKDSDGVMKLTVNYESLLKLSKNHSDPGLLIALELGRLRTRAQMLSIKCDKDGRMKCSYNLVGTETGRVTSSRSAIGWGTKSRVGTNMQTVSDDWDMGDDNHPLAIGLRNLYVADENCWMIQCDLKGADGWTIAPHLAALGDRTLLDDYLFGLKPAQLLCYMLRHGPTSLAGKDRAEIAILVKEVKKTDWDYFACKVGIWGTFYLMGPRKLAEQCFLESDGKFNMSESEAKDFQRLVFIRYRGKLWHEKAASLIDKQGYPPKLTCASGATRRFFGRKREILGEWLAHEPQVNTTYATNMAAYKLWMDPENRRPNGSLHVEPLHQVHDALLMQVPKPQIDWAITKIKQWFDNPIIIAGQKITIPWEGNYGPSWGEMDYVIV